MKRKGSVQNKMGKLLSSSALKWIYPSFQDFEQGNSHNCTDKLPFIQKPF